LLRGKGFAQPNPRPMFPNAPGLLALSLIPKGCVIESGGERLPMPFQTNWGLPKMRMPRRRF